MPIPEFGDLGLLPPGIHECTLREIGDRFGAFTRSDRRVRLYQRLCEFFREATSTGVVSSIVVDGSFVTSKPEPNDIDLILIVAAGHDFLADLPPYVYNVLSVRRVRRRYDFDILVAEEGSEEFREFVEFFMRRREVDGITKGLLRVTL